MTDKVQKIREEVERLKSNLMYGACSSQIAMETRCKEEAYNEVLAILDTLQEEPISEDLEEAAKKAGQKYFPDENNIWARPNYEAKAAEYAFKDGCNWQKKQMIDKACEFLKSYRQDTPDGTGYIAGIVNDKTIKDFKKAMEE